MTTTLHKRESKSNSSQSNPLYVVASFAGGVVIFVTLFVACCVFSLTQRPTSGSSARPKCFRPSSSLETESLRNSQYDTNEVTELTRLHVEEEKQQVESNSATSTEASGLLTSASSLPVPGSGGGGLRIAAVTVETDGGGFRVNPPSDEGYKSMSSNTASTPSSCSLISPPQKPPSPGKKASFQMGFLYSTFLFVCK